MVYISREGDLQNQERQCEVSTTFVSSSIQEKTPVVKSEREHFNEFVEKSGACSLVTEIDGQGY